MQDVTINGLDRLSERLKELAKEFPESRRELHEQLAEILEREVRGQIAGTLDDAHGKLAGYQARVVGSKGGYAAVRAIDTSSGSNSPGAVTNYNENGHRRRMPSGRARRYRPRIRTTYINGRHFYRLSRANAERELKRAAGQLADEYAKRLREPL